MKIKSHKLAIIIFILIPIIVIFSAIQISHIGKGKFVLSKYDGPEFVSDLHLLKNGEVLVISGNVFEIYNPITGKFTIKKIDENKITSQYRSIQLKDGRILMVGFYVKKSWIYNPENNTLINGPNLHSAKVDFNLTLLKDGNVLIMDTSNPYVEIYDPVKNKFKVIAHMDERFGDGQILLPNNKVLLVPGSDGCASPSIGIFDAKTYKFSHFKTILNDSFKINKAFLFDNELVLIEEKGNPKDHDELYTKFYIQKYNLKTGEKSKLIQVHGGVNYGYGEFTKLNNHQLLYTGGRNGTWIFIGPATWTVNNAAIYDVNKHTFKWINNMHIARFCHRTIRLKDGRVLILGGEVGIGGIITWDDDNTKPTNKVEIFYPPKS